MDPNEARDTDSEPRPLRVVQISDTHLSHRRAYAVPNVTAVLDWIQADPPDVIVHTGDITADDPDDVEEAAFARELLLARGLPIVAIPGNHDVGGFSGDLVEDRRRDAFSALWGTDSWTLDVVPWRLVGANVYRLDDPVHLAWLASALATDRPIALFIHQPICLVHPDEPDDSDLSLPMEHRRRLLELMDGRAVRIVASGHLHRYRAGRLPGDTATVWCPAASFGGQEWEDGSTCRVGAVEHVLAPDGRATHRFVEPPGVTHIRFHDLVPPGSHNLRDAPLHPLEERQ